MWMSKKLQNTRAVSLLVIGIIIGTPSVHAYQKIKLNLEGNVTEDLNRYHSFIKSVRSEIPVQAEVHGIPLLYAPHQLHESAHFIEVELKSPKRRELTLGLCVLDLNIVGFRLLNLGAYYFSDTRSYAKKYLFKGASNFFTKEMTQNNEEALQRDGEVSRDDLTYSLQSLYDAIDKLHENVNDKRQQAISMQTFNLFISEALRFTEVENYMEQSVDPGHYASQLIRYDTWYNMSYLIVSAPENGVMATLIDIKDGTHYYVYELWEFLAFLIYTCQPRTVGRGSFPLVPRISTPAPVKKGLFSLLSKTPTDAHVYETCPPPLEDKHLITGLKHFCVDVKNGNTTDGNPVILIKCEGSATQDWEIKNDGTIQTEGKCLTASQDPLSGSFVVISDCNDQNYPSRYWQVKVDTSEIVNVASDLYLTTRQWGAGEIDKVAKERKFKLWSDPEILDEDLPTHILSLEPRNFTLGQGWMLRKDYNARSSTIMTSGNRCIQKDDNNINLVLGDCDETFWKQRWTFYADGSIRIRDDEDSCLSHDETFKNLNVTIAPCNGQVRGQRWDLRPDGTYRSFGTDHGLVVREDSEEQHIFISKKGEPLAFWVLPLIKMPKDRIFTSKTWA